MNRNRTGRFSEILLVTLITQRIVRAPCGRRGYLFAARFIKPCVPCLEIEAVALEAGTIKGCAKGRASTLAGHSWNLFGTFSSDHTLPLAGG
jgi:hypothetical protein